jgi:beta-lactamase class A
MHRVRTVHRNSCRRVNSAMQMLCVIGVVAVLCGGAMAQSATPPTRINPVPVPVPAAPAAAQKPDAAALWAAMEATLAEHKFESSVLVQELTPGGGATTLFERDADARRAVGTTAMLFVHAAATELVREGGIQWSTPIALDRALRSWPYSQTLDLPDHTEMPLAEWCRRMLSLNDNTAADHLMMILGRDRVEQAQRRVRAQVAGEAAAEADAAQEPPFLMTGELYRLKTTEVGKFLEDYAKADAAARRAMLQDVVPGAAVSEFVLANWRAPQRIDEVGWFASARELAALALELDRAANAQGMAPATDAWRMAWAAQDQRWRRVVGKLGGEPGVVAGVWLLDRVDGRRFVCAIVLNDTQAAVPDHITVKVLRQAMDAIFAHAR